MTGSDPKTDLHRYLQAGREALVWKLDGLSEYNIRRPMVPTGTNLLGLIKHVASVELGYFGDCFGRPFDEPLPWLEDDAEPNADMGAGRTAVWGELPEPARERRRRGRPGPGPRGRLAGQPGPGQPCLIGDDDEL